MNMLRVLVAMFVLGSITLIGAQQQSRDIRADAALQRAIALETVDGKLSEAIAAYKKVVSDFPSSRTVAAEALARLGQCYEKQGATQIDEARKTYQQLVANYGDQKDASGRAAARLLALGATNDSPRLSLKFDQTSRRVIRGISLDGRFAYLNDARTAGGAVPLIRRDLELGTEQVFPSPALGIDEVLIRQLSPDGRHMALASSSPRNACAMHVSNADGSSVRLVATVDLRECHDVVWSDDGTRLLVWGETTRDDTHDFALLSLRDGRTLWRYGKDATSADWSRAPMSPDGRFIAIVERPSVDEISLIDSQTGAAKLLGSNVAPSSPIWTADGRALLFVAGRPGERSLWRVAVSPTGDFGRMEQVRAEVGSQFPLRALRDGSMYYRSPVQAPPPAYYIATIDPRSGTADSVSVLAGLHRLCGFVWSPDGSSFAYGARLLKEYAGDTVPCSLLVVRSLSDAHERVISPGFSEIRRPAMSPDGKNVAVFGRKDGTAGVYLIDLQSGASRLVVTAPPHQTVGEDILTADWSRDGKGLFLGRIELEGRTRRDRLVYRDLQSGEETEHYSKTLPGRVFFTSTSVSKNGDVCLLANEFVDGAEHRSAIVIPAGGGPARTAVRVPIASRFSWASWAADGESILVDSPSPTVSQPLLKKLFRYPLDGGPAVDLQIARPSMGNHYPSPDGRTVVFATFPPATPGTELWKIAGAGASMAGGQK